MIFDLKEYETRKKRVIYKELYYIIAFDLIETRETIYGMQTGLPKKISAIFLASRKPDKSAP